MPDFFNTDCREVPRKDILYGLCDPLNGKAYSTNIHPETWIATVKNDSEREVSFTAIDKCLLDDNEFHGQERCDGMLTTDNQLYLVELKDRKPGGVNPEAIAQLESTVKLLYKFHEKELPKFRHKKAFACNRRKQKFQEVDNETQLRFFRTYKFRIDVQASIVII